MYKLFYGHSFYPSGGYRDYIGTYDTIASSKRRIEWQDNNQVDDWAQIVQGDKIVMTGMCKWINDGLLWKWKEELQENLNKREQQ